MASRITIRKETLEQMKQQGLDVIRTIVDIATFHAKDLTPRKTGHNSRSIKNMVKVTKDRATGRIFTESGYGGYLELGTSRMPARPYLAVAVGRAAQQLGFKWDA